MDPARFVKALKLLSTHGVKHHMEDVHCVPLQSVLDQAALRFVDLFSLDVEGGEPAILRTLNLHRTEYGLIVVEDRTMGGSKLNHSLTVEHILSAHGYVSLGWAELNTWYAHPRFYDIYRDVIPDNAWNGTTPLAWPRSHRPANLPRAMVTSPKAHEISLGHAQKLTQGSHVPEV
eukprot:974369-Prymnesium_polylepis.1